MRNFLFRRKTRPLQPVGFAFAFSVGTVVIHATAERQMRLEIVSHDFQDI